MGPTDSQGLRVRFPERPEGYRVTKGVTLGLESLLDQFVIILGTVPLSYRILRPIGEDPVTAGSKKLSYKRDEVYWSINIPAGVGSG